MIIEVYMPVSISLLDLSYFSSLYAGGRFPQKRSRTKKPWGNKSALLLIFLL
jgi:hypothetical protein